MPYARIDCKSRSRALLSPCICEIVCPFSDAMLCGGEFTSAVMASIFFDFDGTIDFFDFTHR